jgi:hypothetical protein
MKRSTLFVVFACLAIFLWASSCQSPSSTGNPGASSAAAATNTSTGSTGSDSGSGSGSGTTTTGFFKLTLTDAPAKDAKNIWLTFSKIRVHQACETEENCFITVWENPTNIEAVDLLKLKNYPISFNAELPIGKYNQIRMEIIKGEIVFGAPGPADPVNDKRYPLDVPSDEIKTHLQFEVIAGGMTEITLDLDAEKSIHVVKKGKTDEYKLRPVVNVVQVTNTIS